MADQRDIDATIDTLHAAGATDDEVTSIIREKYGKPFDVTAQNATMRANMAAQSEAANEHVLRDSAAPWSTANMLDRAKAGVRGEVKGVVAGSLGPALALASAVRHPLNTMDTLGELGLGGLAFANKAVDDPMGTARGVVDTGGRALHAVANNPEAIGGAAGGVMGAAMLPAAFRFARTTDLGQGALEAAERIPVAGRVVRKVVPSNASMESDFSTAMNAADERAAAPVARAAAQHDEALATNREIDRSARVARTKLQTLDSDFKSAMNDADTRAGAPAARMAASHDEALATNAQMDRSARVAKLKAAAAKKLADAAAAAAPERQLGLPDNPLYKQQDAMDTAQILSGTAPPEPLPPAARSTTPVHLQTGLGGRGQEDAASAAAIARATDAAPSAEAATSAAATPATVSTPENADAVSRYLKRYAETGEIPEDVLIGTRKAGHLPLAQRTALFRALAARMAEGAKE